MNYNSAEISAYSAQPIELYHFADSADTPNEWNYTSGDEMITYSGDNYTPIAISRNTIKAIGSIRGDTLQLRVARDNAVAVQWVSLAPMASFWLTVYRWHRNTTNPNDVVVIWRGRVRAVSWQGSEAILECEPLIGLLKRPALRARFQFTCNHQLYDGRCRKLITDQTPDPENVEFTQTIVVDSISSNGLTITASPDLLATELNSPDGGPIYETFFRGGYAIDDAEVDGTGERRFIVAHDGAAGATITLWQPFIALVAGDLLTVIAGCDRSAATCAAKFGNIVNFGGFPAMPPVNPFSDGVQ